MSTKRLTMETAEACGLALREINASSSDTYIQAIIDEGYEHLKQLRASSKCNPLLINGLCQSLDYAEDCLQQRKRIVQQQEEETARRKKRLELERQEEELTRGRRRVG